LIEEKKKLKIIIIVTSKRENIDVLFEVLYKIKDGNVERIKK